MTHHRILVVEDETALSGALHDKLTREHYEVVVVDDGEKGLNSAINSHPDAIILDMIMPHMGGMEMLSRLRNDAWGATVPVLILTNVGNVSQSPALLNDPHVIVLSKSDTSLETVLSKVKVLVSKTR